jgi:copper chaperone
MTECTLNVEGMSCSHCEKSVKGALMNVDGVTGVSVDLTGKTVCVSHTGAVTLDTIKKCIEDLGFDVMN